MIVYQEYGNDVCAVKCSICYKKFYVKQVFEKEYLKTVTGSFNYPPTKEESKYCYFCGQELTVDNILEEI